MSDEQNAKAFACVTISSQTSLLVADQNADCCNSHTGQLIFSMFVTRYQSCSAGYVVTKAQ